MIKPNFIHHINMFVKTTMMNKIELIEKSISNQLPFSVLIGETFCYVKVFISGGVYIKYNKTNETTKIPDDTTSILDYLSEKFADGYSKIIKTNLGFYRIVRASNGLDIVCPVHIDAAFESEEDFTNIAMKYVKQDKNLIYHDC